MKKDKDKKTAIPPEDLEDNSWIFGYDQLEFILHPYSSFFTVFMIRFIFTMTFGEKDHHPD